MPLEKKRKKSFQCERCKSSYALKHLLREHVSSVHEGIKPFECEICETRFARKQHLQTHTLSVHEGIKPFNCEICESHFATVGQLERHISSVHDRKKQFRCDTCHTSFSLEQHLKRHHKYENRCKPIKCFICDVIVNSNMALITHFSKVHEGKKPFQCSQCEGSFVSSQSLKGHV